MDMKNISELIQTDRLKEQFISLVEIDSPSFHERKMADYLKSCFLDLGIVLEEDQANDIYNSETGNLYGIWKGEIPGVPLLFSCHMDTVEPALGKKAVIHEDGTITSEGITVLGADDLAGMSEILEAVKVITENHIPHRDIEFLLPFAEEAYTKGSREFDFSKLKAKEGFFFDLSKPVGYASLKEPTLISFSVSFTGKASHAGFAPEQGINAIAAASMWISQVKQGRIDEETVLNIGTIHGGTATNIVSEHVEVCGELRSYSRDKADQLLKEIFQKADSVAKITGAKVATESLTNLTSYRIQEDEPVVKHYQAACEVNHTECVLTETFGGSDNNSFCRSGGRGIVCASAMYNCHTVQEYTNLTDMKTITGIIGSLMTIEETE